MADKKMNGWEFLSKNIDEIAMILVFAILFGGPIVIAIVAMILDFQKAKLP